MNTKVLAAIVPLAMLVSACGETWGQRATTGAGIGAAAGAGVGLLAGFPLIGSTLIGGLVGAGVGAGTSKEIMGK
jgi:osmotically inducible lipoprotein OsmB